MRERSRLNRRGGARARADGDGNGRPGSDRVGDYPGWSRPREPVGRPVPTWALLAAAVVATGFIPLVPAAGSVTSPLPLTFLLLPVLLGWIGAVFAVRSRHYWWAGIAFVWGFLLVQALIVVTTLIGGP